MTPEERNLIIDLFDRLATLEDAQRDPDAERLIRDGLRQAPNAPYALVQTVLVQDEALKRADERIRELEAGSATETAARDTSFLGGIRSMMGGQHGAQAAFDPKAGAAETSPGSGGSAGGDLSREAGLNDIGHSPASSGDSGGSRGQGLLDDSQGVQADRADDDFDDGGLDIGGSDDP